MIQMSSSKSKSTAWSLLPPGPSSNGRWGVEYPQSHPPTGRRMHRSSWGCEVYIQAMHPGDSWASHICMRSRNVECPNCQHESLFVYFFKLFEHDIRPVNLAITTEVPFTGHSSAIIELKTQIRTLLLEVSCLTGNCSQDQIHGHICYWNTVHHMLVQ